MSIIGVVYFFVKTRKDRKKLFIYENKGGLLYPPCFNCFSISNSARDGQSFHNNVLKNCLESPEEMHNLHFR